MLAEHVFRSVPLWHWAGLQDRTLHNPVGEKVNGLGPVGIRLRSQRFPSIGDDGNFLR